MRSWRMLARSFFLLFPLEGKVRLPAFQLYAANISHPLFLLSSMSVLTALQCSN